MSCKTLFVLFLMNVFCYNLASAQVTKESYDKAVDFLNCRAVELTLTDKNVLAEYNKKCPCETTNYSAINSFLTTTGNLKKTIELSIEIEGLKKIDNTDWDSAQVVYFLTETILNDKNYPRLLAFADKRRKTTAFEEFRNGILGVLPGKLTFGKDDQTTADSAEARTFNATGNDDSATRNILGDLSGRDQPVIQIILISVIASLAFSGGALIVALKISAGRTDNGLARLEEIMRLDKNRMETLVYDQKKTRGTTEELNTKDSQSKMEKLLEKVGKLEKRIAEMNGTTSVNNQTNPGLVTETEQPETKKESFFLSTPNADGTFNESSASAIYREGASIYKFTKTAYDKAFFRIDDRESSIKLAIQYPDKNIDPVCEALNAFNPRATRIKTETEGVAQLEGDKWVKTTKAKIRYES